MPLQRHHKIIIGGVSSLLVIVLIANSIFMYWVYTKQVMNYNELTNRIEYLQNDTQMRFNELSNNLLTTKKCSLRTLGVETPRKQRHF